MSDDNTRTIFASSQNSIMVVFPVGMVVLSLSTQQCSLQTHQSFGIGDVHPSFPPVTSVNVSVRGGREWTRTDWVKVADRLDSDLHRGSHSGSGPPHRRRTVLKVEMVASGDDTEKKL